MQKGLQVCTHPSEGTGYTCSPHVFTLVCVVVVCVCVCGGVMSGGAL